MTHSRGGPRSPWWFSKISCGYGAAVTEPSVVTPAPEPGAPATPWGWILATTMLCFLPLGLVAIVFGIRADRARQGGDLQRCQRAVRTCRGWIIAALVVGLLIDGIIAATLLLLGAFPR